jgi:hypothetical protein
MLEFTQEPLSGGRVHKYSLTDNAQPLRYAAVLDLWQHDDAFRSFFFALLRDSPFSAYRWETPPITRDTVDRPFEFVLLDAHGLACTPDATAFAGHFTADDSDQGIVDFDNLGRDATLVVPSPRAPESVYGHLAAFIRVGPDSQRHALWRTVGRTASQKTSHRPTWISTAGGGVAWLHVRLDSRPKYYGFRPYTTFP